MEYYTALPDMPGSARHSVLAIGNFDGVHKGHRALLQQVTDKAHELGVPAGVLTFEPHPRHLFRPDDPPFRITPLPVKLCHLAACGLDFVCALPFDWAFASQSAEDFIERVLKNGLDPSQILVGQDFRFGQLRRGSPETLEQAGYAVTRVQPVLGADGVIYSSSAIREALRLGDIGRANALLGWDWIMEGVVQRGDRRGRELGFPTANVPLGETLHPAYGIYAAFVQIVDGKTESPWLPSATNIGIRPMFEIKIGQVEAHILDYSGDCYGKTLRIRPVRRLRGEARFDGIDALVAQMQEDCRQAKAILSG